MNRQRQASTEEVRLWRLATRDVLPLAGRPWPEEEPVPSAPALPAEPPARDRQTIVPAQKSPKPAMPPLAVGEMPGVDRRTGDRLRRGRLDIDGRIDLHGMTQAEAHVALMAFVHRGWREGRRCVLVITGKGMFSEVGGILRRAVPRWLAEPPLRPMVVACQPAQPKDGGEGALYVLLRRRREGR